MISSSSLEFGSKTLGASLRRHIIHIIHTIIIITHFLRLNMYIYIYTGLQGIIYVFKKVSNLTCAGRGARPAGWTYTSQLKLISWIKLWTFARDLTATACFVYTRAHYSSLLSLVATATASKPRGLKSSRRPSRLAVPLAVPRHITQVYERSPTAAHLDDTLKLACSRGDRWTALLYTLL